MKRKRGHKKGKHKQSHAANVSNVNTEVVEDQDLDNVELDSETEVQVMAPGESDEPAKLVKTHAVGFTDTPSGHGRVKVKLKTSKKLDSSYVQSDAQTQSDTDKSSSHLSLEKQEEVVERMNDGADLLPEIQPTVSGSFSRKAGSIKIKSSRSIGPLSTPINQTIGFSHDRGDRTAEPAPDKHKTVGKSHHKEQKFSHQDSQYNEEELSTSLAVIRKIMKMDAAEPFNSPVDPIALGIPDYFDIIKTPMDFSTICNNLEQGHMYNNSEDVYKDVQYIWENCYKYNNKGDYIVDLMKRVKKNFMKYWTAAGLYTNQPNKFIDAALGQDSSIELPLRHDQGRDIMPKQETVGHPSFNANERLQVETAVPSSQDRMHVKGTHSKHKKRGRHGFNKHKSDCLCAVCVVRRRKREGNAKVLENPIQISDGNTSQEFKQEETYIDNHYTEDASSNLDHSPDPDVDEQSERMKLERPVKYMSPQQEINDEVEIQDTSENDHSEQFQLGGGSTEGPNPQSRSEEMEDKYGTSPHQKEEAEEVQKAQQKNDTQMAQQQKIMCNNLLINRNPSTMKLCGILFPSNRNSVWSGPHSFGHHNAPIHSRRRGIHDAVEMFMK